MGRFLRWPRERACPDAARLLAVVAICAAMAACAGGVAGEGESGLVERVVDGDTLLVRFDDGSMDRVRLIGVDTPETVHPKKPVEYFGKEASAFTRRMVQGKVVRLEPDSETLDRDRYKRLLRYVFLPDGTHLNAEILAQGYGYAYTKFPFQRMDEFRKLANSAREKEIGLWSPREVPPGTKVLATAALGDSAGSAPGGSVDAVSPSGQPDDQVFVTRSGSRYHAKGCRFLKEGAMAIRLADAATDFQPCKVCDPPVLSAQR